MGALPAPVGGPPTGKNRPASRLRVYTEPEKAFSALITSGRAAGVSFDMSQASVLLKKMREPV